ncbi:hypothetical protein, conserved [Leishmania tarentolae]|uniref:Uncharacterized protein n=1 Tax=Leishmania tarentolae TaxID=5689 RepID=A0A640L090_LEITA|nr:hypothetical protein, conserved [Leishmania tarentolae]
MLFRNVSRYCCSDGRCWPSLVVALGTRRVDLPQGGHLRRLTVFSRGIATAASVSTHHVVLSFPKRCEHTTTIESPTGGELTTKEHIDELMECFAEASELISDANESIGTTYFSGDLEDAEKQTQEVLNRWASLQAALELKGTADELKKVRNMYDLKIKQLKAELETVREAGGAD